MTMTHLESNATLDARTQFFDQLDLYTSNPGKTNTGTLANYGGYAPVDLSSTPLASAANSVSTTLDPIVFPACTSGSNVITHFGLKDGAGVLRCYGALAAPLTVTVGVIPSIAIGALTVAID